jgi:hypothetical protein
MERISRLIGAVGLLLAFAFHARVGHACTATAADVFSVGNTATDSSCNYGSIQAAITAATCPAGTRIILNQSGNYTNQHLTITDKNITLVGRVNTSKCNTLVAVCGITLPCPVGPLQTITGNSGAVITVRGNSNVTLSHLTITGGHGDNGGGIDYSGIGAVNIDNSAITDNHANNGAGIRFVGAGGVADLYLNPNTFIHDNIAAHTGGGIRADEQAKVHIDADPIGIYDNQAGDNGGGVAMVGGAFAHIGSPSILAVFHNKANYGGGIAVLAESTGWPEVDIFVADPSRPVHIEENEAYFNGGGIYLRPWSSFPTDWYPATVKVGGAHIDYNVAKEGSAIYTDVPQNALPARTELFFYAGHCAAGVECNTMSNNQTEDIINGYQPTSGSTLLLQTNTWATLHELTMRGNGDAGDPGIPAQSAHAIRIVDSLNSPLILDTCLLAGNKLSTELVTFGSASATMNQCTIAGNEIGGASVTYAESGVSITNSIIEQGSLPAVQGGSGGGRTLDYLLLSPTAPYLGATHVINADGGFVDPSHGNYHLLHSSHAVDVAPSVAGDDRDLDNRPRDQDVPSVMDHDGDRDLGAYEFQLGVCDAADTVFCNGFEQN